ncbi:hypothetical protein QP948_05640 [Corynebacterium bovis]|uniref:hypothetical protein n=1 Tax=Corynebacterium bovis TaxID=36808 RepID=UPI00254A9015|nr:hypothetical protein [Corynebacterium bovis]MDK8510888.1 hypothetical protein [Corynebacterium bovis]
MSLDPGTVWRYEVRATDVDTGVDDAHAGAGDAEGADAAPRGAGGATDRAGDPAFPTSFDQRRHCAPGTRPGTWMALSFPVAGAGPALRDRVAAAWMDVIARHGTLRTVVNPDARSLTPVEVTGLGWSRATPSGTATGAPGATGPAPTGTATGTPGATGPSPTGTATGAPGATGPSPTDPRTVLRGIFDTACEPFARPSHALCLVEHPPAATAAGAAPAATGTPRDADAPTDAPAPARSTVVVGMDHSHTDAWSLRVLLRDLAVLLHDPEAPLPPAPSFTEHTRDLRTRPSAPEEVHARWRHILDVGDGGMPVFPLDLGPDAAPGEPDAAADTAAGPGSGADRGDDVVDIHRILDPAGVTALEAAARAAGVRPIALAVSAMTAVTQRMSGQPLRAVFPVHSRRGPDSDPARWQNSVGWFITNSVLECTSTDPAECADAVRAAVRLGGHPLAPILDPSGEDPCGGMPNTRGMFALSWLDNRRLPVAVPASADIDGVTADAQHVSADVRTDGVMVWFVLDDTGLTLRCRYPDTPTARRTAGAWTLAVCDAVADAAAGA